jgi:hypothetical protein
MNCAANAPAPRNIDTPRISYKITIMKMHSKLQLVSLAAGLAICPLMLAATPAPPAQATADLTLAPLAAPSPQPVVWLEANRRKLRHAYWILEQADHNYQGHRGKAMEEIRKAGKVLRMDLKGDGYGGKKPVWSDALLREAKHNLEEIYEDYGGEEQRHIHAAIREINYALELH